MTREEIVTAYNDCNTAIDKLANERDIHRAQAQQCEDERQKWARRRFAWASIYLNLFDEEMPELISEETNPIYGNQMTVEDVIKIKEGDWVNGAWVPSRWTPDEVPHSLEEEEPEEDCDWTDEEIKEIANGQAA